MKDVLLVFVKNPVLGKVKSRLANSIGEERALLVYKKLLEKTKEVASEITCDKVVCYSDIIDESDIWDAPKFLKTLQIGDNLGDKMFNSILWASNNSYDRICLIGSDNMEITKEILVAAFEGLKKHDIVIGPAKDGGYYLIGMNQPVELLFRKKNWGASSVLVETIKDIRNLGLKFKLLPKLSDIDIIEDIRSCDRDFLLL